MFGLGPALAGRGPGLVAEPRSVSRSLPSQIVGLEGYSLWGKNAGAAAAVSYKHTLTSVPVGSRQVCLRYGLLGGVSVASDNARALVGGFVEAEVEGLAGVVLVVRLDDGVYVNPGFKVNLISVSF